MDKSTGGRIRPGSALPHRTLRGAAPGRACAGILVAALALGVCGCGQSDDGSATQKVNGSVHMVAGRPAESATTVNGGINIDDGAAVTSATTVNGSIHLGAHASADALKTVNGSITVDAGGHVAKDAESVNGGISLRDGAEVLGAVGNVNGKIELNAAHVGGGIRTVNGSIMVFGASHVEGGLLVEKNHGQLIHFGDDVPRIAIGPGATVLGDLRFERAVKLYVSDRATIGPVTGATPIAFSGDTPPAD